MKSDKPITLVDKVLQWQHQLSPEMKQNVHWFMNNKHRGREFSSFGEAWYNQLMRIVLYGQPSSPRSLDTLELCGESFRVENLRACLAQHPARRVNHRFSIAEFLWILSGSDDLDLIAQFNKNLRQFSDDGKHMAGAYGTRLIHQWPYIFECLTKPDTRQAVATIWTPSPQPSKDIPCTVACQWLIRDEKLNVIITMRSSDCVLGLVYDFPVFAQLTNWLACRLGLETGWLQYQLGSSHIYGDKLDMVLEVLEHPESLSTWIVDKMETPLQTSGAEKMLYPATWNDKWDGDLQFFVDVLKAPNQNQVYDVLDNWCGKVA